MDRRLHRPRAAGLTGTLVIALFAVLPAGAEAQGQWRQRGDTVPRLGLDQGVMELSAPRLSLGLVRSSQTVASLRPRDIPDFDFTPNDWLERRAANGFYHLGDLTLRLRSAGSGEWQDYSTATDRRAVGALPASSPVLAAADLSPTLPADIPVRIRRFWEVRDGHLVLRFQLRNATDRPVEIGALGVPMVFNNILSERSLAEAHVVASFHDPYIGNDAGYLQVTRLERGRPRAGGGSPRRHAVRGVAPAAPGPDPAHDHVRGVLRRDAPQPRLRRTRVERGGAVEPAHLAHAGPGRESVLRRRVPGGAVAPGDRADAARRRPSGGGGRAGVRGAVTFILANRGSVAEPDPGLHPDGATDYVGSGIYRLEASVEGDGWSARLLNALVAVEPGGSRSIPVLVTPERGAAEAATVTLRVTSESDRSRTATATTEVSR